MKNAKLLGATGTISETKKSLSNFHKKKEGETNDVTINRELRPYQMAPTPAPMSYI